MEANYNLNRDRYVCITRPLITCPSCKVSSIHLGRGGPIRQMRGASDGGDGSQSRPMRCETCGHSFTLIIESE